VANGELDTIGGEEPGPEDLASVVTIEPGEDVAAICGRVDAAPTWAVVIHAPGGNRQLSQELGMRRLLHHAAESGKVVAIATRSTSLASRARELEVPVARKPQHIRWDAGGRHVIRVGRLSLAPPSIGRYVQVAVIAGVAFVGLFLAFAMAPSATVVAYPPTETVERTITVSASEAWTEINLETLEVPASRVAAEQRLTLVAPTTGTVQVGTVPAKARVTISNGTQAAVAVGSGTVLLAAPDFFPFVVDEAVTVPAGGAVEVGVTAGRAGVAGNVPAGAITGFEPERLRFLKVTNAAPAAGGVSEPRQAVDARDIAAILQLAAALEESEAVRAALLQARPHDAVFMSTASSKVTPGTPRPAAGTPSTIVLLDVTVNLSALAVLESTLDEVARQVLFVEGSEGEFVPGTVRAVETGARQLDADTATIRTELRVQGELARGVTTEDIRSAVSGKTEERALSTLSERYGIEDAEVNLSPWAPRLPRFGFRINVELAAREEAESSAAAPTDDTAANATSAPAPTAGP